jgi:hypothetical protein
MAAGESILILAMHMQTRCGMRNHCVEVADAEIVAGANRLSDVSPEWNQDVEGYAKRFGSDIGTAAVGTTACYGLVEAFKKDPLHYCCECEGVLQRMGHAVLSTLTARRDEDGNLDISFPALVAPSEIFMIAVYGWHPNRFGTKDAFCVGNCSLLANAGSNISVEFFYSEPHSLLPPMHLNNTHGSPVQGPNN